MVTNNLKIVLFSGMSVGARAGHVEMSTRQMFHVEPTQPLPFEEWQTLILRPLQNFVSFVSDQAAWINKVTVSHSARLVGPRGRRYPDRVTVYGYWAKRDKEPPDNLTTSSFLLNLDDIVTVFERVLSNWLRLSRDFKNALTLFFGPRYADHMYGELSFLMLAQALEVFHRTKYPIKRGNDPFYKTRIVDLVNYAGPAVSKLVGQPPDRWANEVKNTRNDLTHWNPVREGIEPGTQEFFDMRRQADILMKIVLLRELGFSESDCVRLLANNWEYRHARGPSWGSP